MGPSYPGQCERSAVECNAALARLASVTRARDALREALCEIADVNPYEPPESDELREVWFVAQRALSALMDGAALAPTESEGRQEGDAK